MIALIYRQTLSLRCDEHNESSSVTLMSTDIDQYMHSIWARSIEVAIGTTLLALQLGWPCVVPVLVVICTFLDFSLYCLLPLLTGIYPTVSSLGSTLVANMTGNKQKRWVEAVQRRVSITASDLGHMKGVKMTGLTEIVSTMIQNQRIRETNHQASYRWISVWLNLIGERPFFFFT